jgi:Zn-dependent M28 family amino/carboxypeptidase
MNMRTNNKIAAGFSIIALLASSTMVEAKQYKPKISAARISQDTKTLGSDEFEGRGVATRAEIKTIDFIAKSLASASFAPAGDNGSWYQDVKLRHFKVVNPNLTLNLNGKTKQLEIGKDITVSSRGAMGDVTFDKTPLIFVGYGIYAPERNWNDFKDENGNDIDVKGKIIVVLINDADYYQPELNTFKGKAMTYYGRWTYKFEEAARRGAAGCLIIHETGPASYGWETVKNSNRGEKLDIVRDDPSKASPKLESWISFEQAKEIFAASGQNLEALKIAARKKDFHAVPLNGISLDGSFGMNNETVTSHNVVGIIKGKKRPDEYVLYTAHWDHLGIGLPDKSGDNIFNGALDNATGVASIIELARSFKTAPQPDRSIVMIGWTAEESGLLGSEYYATNPIYPLEKTVAGFNIDGINIVGRSKNLQITGIGQTTLEDDLVKYAKAQGRYITPEDKPESGGFYRSDHFPFAKRGVPFLTAESGVDLVKGGKAAGKKASEEYVSANYHQPNDEWSAKWDLSGAIEDLKIYFEMGYDLANSKKWPQFKPNSEFKAARDKTEALRK